MKKLVKMADGIKLKDVEISSEPCSICMEGKQTRLPHQTERIRAKRPLQLVHSDLCGPMDTTSYDRKRYLLTFIEDFTHFTIAYTLQAKSEVLKYYISKCFNQWRKHISTGRSVDSGVTTEGSIFPTKLNNILRTAEFNTNSLFTTLLNKMEWLNG
ncbi:Copia protein [Trachymyrmex zeteki]|uniref:Copia protein n=1 Tax=Mycetomoellerius zeteki TaxID=64791 RepID=A0A151XAB2_9HYME|nr:Copia protein [Trachymyrmex zeteki]